MAGNACFSVLAKRENVEALVKEDRSLMQKIVDFFSEFLTKIENALQNLAGSNAEYRSIHNDIEAQKQMVAMMKECLNAAKGSEGKSSGAEYARRNTEEYDANIVSEDVNLIKTIGRKNIVDLSSENKNATEKLAYKYFRQMGTKSPFFRAWFGEWRAYDSTRAVMPTIANKDTEKTSFTNQDTGWNVIVSRKTFKETKKHQGKLNQNAIKYLDYIDDIVEKAILLNSEVSDKENVNSLLFHSFYAYTNILGYPALLRLRVEELYDEKNQSTFNRAYILQNIKEEVIPTNYHFSKAVSVDKTSSTDSISDLVSLVKQYDKDFRIGHEVNPALLNEDGTPKVFYHGTDETFTAFDRNKIGNNYHYSGRSNYGGFFFYDKQSAAQRKGKNVMLVYLSSQNPYVVDLGDNDYFFNGAEYWDLHSEDMLEKLEREDYDSVIIKHKNADLVVVKNANQIKSATDNIGTFDKGEDDIRYARQERLTQEQRDIRNLTRQNATLSDAYMALKEALRIAQTENEQWRRGELTNRRFIDRDYVHTLARDILKQYGSKYDIKIIKQKRKRTAKQSF